MRSGGAESGKSVVVEINQALREKGKTHPDTSESPTRLREEGLVDRLRSGDPSAASVFYEIYHPQVRRFIRLRLANSADAEDLVHETFERAYRSIHGFQGRSSLRTWLLGIARHVCSNYYRSSKRWMIGSHPVVSPLREECVDARIEDRVGTRRSLERCLEIVDKYRGPLRHRYSGCDSSREYQSGRSRPGRSRPGRGSPTRRSRRTSGDRGERLRNTSEVFGSSSRWHRDRSLERCRRNAERI